MLHAHPGQDVVECAEMDGIEAGNRDLAAARRDGDRERARLDPVADDGVLDTRQLGPADDLEDVGAVRSIRAPIVRSMATRSSTSGSWAAFSMTVDPSARHAARRAFSVPITVT